jgi:hypothetical protein
LRSNPTTHCSKFGTLNCNHWASLRIHLCQVTTSHAKIWASNKHCYEHFIRLSLHRFIDNDFDIFIRNTSKWNRIFYFYSADLNYKSSIWEADHEITRSKTIIFILFVITRLTYLNRSSWRITGTKEFNLFWRHVWNGMLLSFAMCGTNVHNELCHRLVSSVISAYGILKIKRYTKCCCIWVRSNI